MARRPPKSFEDHDAELLIEFCVEGVALSAQSKNRTRLRAWQDRVARQAKRTFGSQAMFEGSIEIRLTEFSEARSADRDNVAKPIVDALEGVLFLDDRQVARLESEWCDIDGRYRVRFMSKAVADALIAGGEFVWVRICPHRPRETLTP